MVYAAVATDRGGEALAVVGAVGLAAVVAAAALRQPAAVPFGLAVVAVEYATFLLLRGDTVDEAAPLVAGALVAAGELAYSAVEPPLASAGAGLKALRALRGLAAVVGSVVLAAVVLAAAAGDLGSAALVEAVGIVAAVAALGLLAVLARSTATRS